MVSIKVKREVLYALSKGDPQTAPITTVYTSHCLSYHRSEWT